MMKNFPEISCGQKIHQKEALLPISIVLLFFIFSLRSFPAMAEFTINTTFSDNMVLQREKPVSVWGTGDPGVKVALKLGTQTKTAMVKKDGHWNINLDPMPSGGPYRIMVEAGSRVVTFENVMVGEVWLCSGQSNMQLTTRDVSDSEEEIQKAADYPDIRLYLVPKFGANQPLQNVNASWKICSPATVGNFSALAYFFGRELKNNPSLKNIPMGLIDSSFGGTTVEAWMSTETLTTRFPREDLRDSFFGFKPSSMYNGMIASLVPYQIRGFLWYQGESNCERPEQYGRLFPGLIESWREAWKQPEMPFLFVQLPNYAENFDGLHYTWLRGIQHQVAQKVPGTGMAVTIDTDDGYDSHPKNKRDPALRLALIARSKVYGEDIPWSGPVYKSHEMVGSIVKISFDYVDKGLVNKNCGPLRGFAMAGEDGQFWNTDASIEGNQVLLSHPRVPYPRYVRYAWEGNPHADLYNTAGLPAAPFRTDSFPLDDLEIYLVPASRTVTTSLYDVLIDGNSWVLSLKVKGEEFLEPMHSSGMPACFFPSIWGPARLLNIQELGPRVLYAEMETASILFEFHEDRMIWTLQNKTDSDLSYNIIFSKGVTFVKTKDDQIHELPFQGNDESTTWFHGQSALRIEGNGSLRFPFSKDIANQTWEMLLKPKDKKQIKLSARSMTDIEWKQIENYRKEQHSKQ